ncbi:T9SS type A sorting domain-containing protein [Maribellus mangrovi]|uniref:T9SS type A sorting domain-containing protein n=1 Tax=Maribellus mangrovi TaxID=3133146 RepID=UPI0030EB6F9F
MKTLKTCIFSLLLVGWIFPASAQTTGTLRFSCLTNAPSGTWGNKHVAAIWIQNNANPSVFVKTNAKYGHDDDHLTSWTAISGKNLVDAVTGATLSTYDTLSIEWDGTNVSHEVVPDGDYTVYIEMGWGRDKTAQHKTTGFSFTKGESVQQSNPAGNSNYSSVSVNWQPTATLVTSLEDKNGIGVFPNPSGGNVQLKFQQELKNVELTVFDLAGKTFYREQVETVLPGQKALDLSGLPANMYLLSIKSDKKFFNYKLIVEKE